MRTITMLCAGWLILGLAGCASLGGDGLIHVTFKDKPGAQESVVRNGIVLRFAGYQDVRGLSDPRQLGVTNQRVGGISGTELRLDREPAALVAEVMQKRLKSAGFELSEQGDAPWVLSGEIREFRYDVKYQDEYAFLIETTVKDGQTGKVIWSAAIQRKDTRFAGVSGNSAEDLAKVLRQELNTIASKTVEGLSMNLQLLRGASSQAEPVASPAAASAPVAATGVFKLSVTPARAKVYVDGVYFGLAPLQTELAAGVHEVQARLEGYQPAAERVSIRKGETTELELTLPR